MKEDDITGILITKIIGKGSRSEGPEYWIQPLDDYKNRWDEILVRKKTMMWQEDPNLHGFIGKTVLIYGEIIETKDTITIDYTTIKEAGD